MTDRIRWPSGSEGPGQVYDRRGQEPPDLGDKAKAMLGGIVGTTTNALDDLFTDNNPFEPGSALNPFEEGDARPAHPHGGRPSDLSLEEVRQNIADRGGKPRRDWEPAVVFREAVRANESANPDGDYFQVRGMVRGAYRLLGAYGIAQDDWEQMASDAGIPDARWQDPRAQDRVAEVTMRRMFDNWRDWSLVAIGWKAGEQVADRIASEPELLGRKELKGLRTYMESVLRWARDRVASSGAPADILSQDMFRHRPEYMLDEIRSRGGIINPDVGWAGGPADTAEEVLRRQMYVMRERIRNIPDETLSPAEVGTGEAGMGLPGIPTGRTGIFGKPETTASAEQIVPAPEEEYEFIVDRKGARSGMPARTNKAEKEAAAKKRTRRGRNRSSAGGTGGVQEY